jgi:eukaryotic-like serine/threonine-protein kinase
MAAPRAPVPVRTLGRYALYREIAAGGMASVHVGRLIGSAGFARTVAIKRLHANYAKDPEFVSMFLDEARLAARIRHPNVVSTIDVVAAEGELFLVMEYVQGESLARLIRRARLRDETVAPELAAPLMTGVLLGLHAAHTAKNERGEPLGIVHRDVSPHNILVGTDGAARVVDFGVAKAVGRVQTTQEGQLKGKLPYMSPEQILGSPPTDKLSDVYSCSVVLWEMLTARRLFDGDNQAQIMRSVLDSVVEPPGDVVPGIPAAMDEIVMRGLSRDPAKRFPSARDMARALETSVAFRPPSAIGDWVEDLAGAELAARADLIAEIETGSFDDTVPMPPRSRPSDTGPGAETLATQLSSGSTSIAEPATIPPPRNRRLVVILGTVAGTMVLAGAFVGYQTRSASDAPAAPSAPDEAPAGSIAPATSASEGVLAPSATAATLPPPSSATAVATTPRSLPPPERQHVEPQPRAPVSRPAPPNCNPPYVIDGTGMKRYKRECL